MMRLRLMLQVSMLTGQVAELQQSLSSLQEETDTTITKLRQELQDKANIVETLQQQIRMKMFMNLTQQKNPMMAALQGKTCCDRRRGRGNLQLFAVQYH